MKSKRIPLDKYYYATNNVSPKVIKTIMDYYGFTFSKKQTEQILQAVGHNNLLQIDRELNGIACLLYKFMEVS